MRILTLSPLLLVASCVGPGDSPPSWEPDYSSQIDSKKDAMRTKAADIALEYSKGSESAEAIATAVVTRCASDINEIVSMMVAQASRGLTPRQRQMFLDGRPEERARLEWRSAVYERAVADVIEFRTDAAKQKEDGALIAGVPKAALAPITYDELMERADKHRRAVLDLPGVDKKSPGEIGGLVADRCRDDIDAHMLLANKNRPADSKLSPTEWDAEMRATLRRLISSMTAAIVAGVREAVRQ